MSVSLTGRDEVLRNLNREIEKIEGRTRTGVRKATLLVRRRSQIKVPVDTGNLRDSAYEEVFDTPQGPVGEIGYTAFYAPYVHENLEARHKVGEAKYLERPLHESAGEILETIRQEARVKR